MRVPIEMHCDVVPYVQDGQVFVASKTKMIQVLEDIGCLKRGRLLDEIVVVSESNYRRYKSLFLDPPKSYFMSYLSCPPEWFYRLCFGDPHVAYREYI